MHERAHGRRRFLPVVGIFAGGFVYALLPAGAFGAHDLAARAAVTGAVAGVTTVVLLLVFRRGVRC